MSTSTTQIEQTGDYAQLVTTLNPIFSTRPFVSFLASNIANDGNIQRLSGTYIKTDKRSGQVGNYLFTNNAFYRKFTDHLTLSDTAKALPDMQGSGMA